MLMHNERDANESLWHSTRGEKGDDFLAIRPGKGHRPPTWWAGPIVDALCVVVFTLTIAAVCALLVVVSTSR